MSSQKQAMATRAATARTASALFVLYLIGRGIAWAAELNAVYDEVKLD